LNVCEKLIFFYLKITTGLRILQDLEQANIIRLIPTEPKTEKLSARLRGSISKETAKQMQVELEQMRNEWQQRNI
jgi:hypothetical protein